MPLLHEKLGVSQEAVAATHQAHLIDLHIDTFIPVRLWNYDISEDHGLGRLKGRFGGHLDLPRIAEGGLSGAMWSVTTNPFRTPKGRWKTVQKNFERLRQLVERTDGQMAIVDSVGTYRDAIENGKHACLFSIQGGNAMDESVKLENCLPDPALTRVTLVHLTNSKMGESSSPYQVVPARGISDLGRALIERLNEKKVIVDLAHISKEGFWQAVQAHDKEQPFMVTHTGVDGVCPHWRNLDDEQIRAVAASGGVIGIMFHEGFLDRPGPKDCSMVIDHVAHVVKVVGEDFVALGSDYDGAITPPQDLRSGNSYPRLVQEMFNRGWTDSRVEKILGENFLRAWSMLRP